MAAGEILVQPVDADRFLIFFLHLNLLVSLSAGKGRLLGQLVERFALGLFLDEQEGRQGADNSRNDVEQERHPQPKLHTHDGPGHDGSQRSAHAAERLAPGHAGVPELGRIGFGHQGLHGRDRVVDGETHEDAGSQDGSETAADEGHQDYGKTSEQIAHDEVRPAADDLGDEAGRAVGDDCSAHCWRWPEYMPRSV